MHNIGLPMEQQQQQKWQGKKLRPELANSIHQGFSTTWCSVLQITCGPMRKQKREKNNRKKKRREGAKTRFKQEAEDTGEEEEEEAEGTAEE